MSSNALEALQGSGIAIASDTGEYLKIGEFYPEDATTNPSLVLAAVKKPEYAHLVEDAVRYAVSRGTSIEAQVVLAGDYLLVRVGTEILDIIPGRVSVSVDPRLANDHDAIVSKGRNLVAIFEELGYPRERVLIKIPATYPGILAAKTLESPSQLPDGTPSVRAIHTNATLVFGLVQALACAQAGISVISPFIGRVRDWWAAQYSKLHDGNAPPIQPLSEHPGILLVQNIRSAYSSYGHTTAIMAAGFRTVDEVIEVGMQGSRGGPDFVTLPPDLLDGLRRRHPGALFGSCSATAVNQPEPTSEPRYIAVEGDSAGAAAKFAEDLKRERIAMEKVPEGLAKFSVDAQGLEDILRAKVRGAVEASARL